MSKPTLHLLGLPHTVTTEAFSHCAFTGKVLRFAPMLRQVGYQVVHYGVEGAESGANEQVDVLATGQWEDLKRKTRAAKNLPEPTEKTYIGDLADSGSILYRVFNQILYHHLRDRVRPGDIICLPFGHAHQMATNELRADKDAPLVELVETGIGYPHTFCRHLVFETAAWMHWHLGKRPENIRGSVDDYCWVAPNYFDASAWDFSATPEKDLVVFFGRLNSGKGLDVVRDVADRRPDLRFILCGQGDPTPWLGPKNVEYLAPLAGRARSDLLGRAMCVLMPTRFVEPFGGVTIEANLCGSPVLGSACGSFTETILEGETGYRCNTLGDFLAALELVEDGKIDRAACRRHGEKYDTSKVGPRYDMIFRQVSDLFGDGWYAMRSRHGEVRRAIAPVQVEQDNEKAAQ